MFIRIDYPKAGHYWVLNSAGNRIEGNDLDSETHYAKAISRSTCGENRWVQVENVLEFWIESGCELYLEPRDSIQGIVRLDWTMEEFFADGGGTSKFIDRFAASLGIHISRFKVAGVRSGSVILDYMILPVAETFTFLPNQGITSTSSTDIKDIMASLQTKKTQSGFNFGAPILQMDEWMTFASEDKTESPTSPKTVVTGQAPAKTYYWLIGVFGAICICCCGCYCLFIVGCSVCLCLKPGSARVKQEIEPHTFVKQTFGKTIPSPNPNPKQLDPIDFIPHDLSKMDGKSPLQSEASLIKEEVKEHVEEEKALGRSFISRLTQNDEVDLTF